MFERAEVPERDLALERAFALFARLDPRQRRALLFAEAKEKADEVKGADGAKEGNAEGSENGNAENGFDERALLEAGLALREVAAARHPMGKLAAAEAWLHRVAETARNEEEQQQGRKDQGLDELLPRAVYSMCLAAVSSLASEVAFVESLLSSKDKEDLAASGSLSYAWTTFCSCVSYLQTLRDETAPAIASSSIHVQLDDDDLPSATTRSFLRITPPPPRVPRVESADYIVGENEK